MEGEEPGRAYLTAREIIPSDGWTDGRTKGIVSSLVSPSFLQRPPRSVSVVRRMFITDKDRKIPYERREDTESDLQRLVSIGRSTRAPLLPAVKNLPEREA